MVEEVTEFYKQTYNNYKDTKQEALKETLRLIHFGVSTHTYIYTRVSLLTLVVEFCYHVYKDVFYSRKFLRNFFYQDLTVM